MVIIGLGSPFLTDDGVGPRVVRELSGRGLPGIRLVEAHAGGLLLLEDLAGWESAVIVDALIDARRSPGEVVVADVTGTSQNADCSHDCTLSEALVMGRALGLDLPADHAIKLVGIVASDVSTFSEALTEPVAAAIPRACDAILALIAGAASGSIPLQGAGIHQATPSP